GGEIADVILDFTEWLTLQDFGRHCIISVRDILSWVNYLNAVCKRHDEEGGAELDLKQDTVQALIHAACLVYIDGIGSGTTVSSSNNAIMARKMCLGFLHNRLSKMNKPDQETLDTLKIYDSSLLREPHWNKDFFGINPFYIPLGPLAESNNLSDYTIGAGTTAMNALRLLRALKLQRPVLLEGSPGVGKTSLVSALAKASGNHLVRINLSEQTDVTDLFGTDLPVEGGKGGEFAWRDGPLLAALKSGNWILLDELNLASQSVLEGLNACFDHRAEIFIPELGMTFQVQQEKTKIFGCQNPYTQGGGRKGLPKSFLNRFTQVFVDHLTSKDMEFIGNSIFPAIDKEIISRMVEFSDSEVSVERRWGQKGSPWEFNLRDIFRWCQLMLADQSPGFFNPGQHVALVYADKMRTEADKAQVLAVFRKVFGEEFEPYTGSRQFHITPLSFQMGFSVLQRSGGAPVGLDPPLSITHQALGPLESLMKCVEMNWMTILVGPTGSGKTSLVRLLALLTGNRLRVMPMNSAMDTTELLGGFEQVDIMRPWQHLLESVYYLVALVARRGLMSLDVCLQDTEFLLQTWGIFYHWLREENPESSTRTLNSEAVNKLEVIVVLLQKLNTNISCMNPLDMSKLQQDFVLLKEHMSQLENGWTNGGFEWLDGMLIQAMQAGDWLLMDNANFCSASVLDRLNALLEPSGSLTINERGVIDGKIPIITPHPNFRLFLTMDPVHGELSRAMRNRGVEIYIPGETDGISWDTLDLKTLLHTAGATGDSVCNLLIEIHKSIKSAIWDSPASSVTSMLHAATLLFCQLQRGVDLPSALQHACQEVYALSQRTTASQKLAQQVIEQRLSILDTKNLDTELLCAGVWPDSFPSALLSTEDSCFSTVLRDGQVLSFCLNTLSLQGKRNRPLSLTDLQRVLQSSSLHEGLVFERGENLEHGDVLQLIPTAVRLVTECASHGDWIMRSRWLSHLGKSFTFAPGLILVDMRWNKQYLDILANKCNFEDEKRYVEFMEELNAVANRSTLHYYYALCIMSFLMHLFTSFCVQILQLLQWLDRFWNVCNMMPADTQGISVMSMHWQWVQKHLIPCLPLLLLGDADVTFELVSSVEHQQHQMTSCGLLKTNSMSQEDGPAEEFPLSQQELQHLSRRAQLWPLMEKVAVLNHLRLSTDFLQLSFSHSLRLQVSRHLRYCLQSTPMSVIQLRPLWFLLKSERAKELPFVWCELLSEALAALWTNSATSDPDRWLKWNPLNPEKQPDSEPHCAAKNMVLGPALLNKAVWSHCALGVLNTSATARQWEPSGTALLLVSNVNLGEWKEQTQQLQDLSAILWDNMAFPALADLRGTDLKLQGAILRRQLQSMAHMLPHSLQEVYLARCESLVEKSNPLIAAEEIQKILSDYIPPKLLPDGVVDTCIACLKQFVENKVQGTNSVAYAGAFWVNMGLLNINLWAPQTIFDPAVKRAYKLNYAQQELAILQTEWKVRSMSSELKTGAELEESSTTDGLKHPRIRYEPIELHLKQAFRPQEPNYGRLFQDLQHYLCSIGQASAVQDLLSHLQTALQSSSSFTRSAIQSLLKEETVWQNSQQCFYQRLKKDYLLYPDVIGPVQTGIIQLRYGMKLVASQITSSLYHVPELSKLVSCLLSFPSVTPSMQSYLSHADFLCSKECQGTLRSLGQLLSQQDLIHVDVPPSTLLLNALLFVQCHALSTGQFSDDTQNIFRHICQALVNEWDEMEKKKRDQEQQEACLYRSRSQQHGTGLTEAQQEEKDFRCLFPLFDKDFSDMSLPSLEGPTDADLEEDEASRGLDEKSFLSTPAMNTVVQIHQRLCLGYAQSLWYRSRLPNSQSNDFIKAMVSSYQIAAPLIAHFYHLIELNQQFTGSELLLSTLIQNTVQGSPGADTLVLNSEGPYDFYQHPNMSEARLCLPVLEQMRVAVNKRLEDWPEHPALVQLIVVIERIMGFSLSSPVAKFLNGLEILLSKAQDWENNASRAVSLQSNIAPVTQLIIKWHKLELNCWSSSLDNAVKRHTEKSTKHWFSIYQLLAKYLEDQMMNANTGLSLSSLSSTLQAFVEGSSLGEFHTRLAMLLSFHCHFLLLPTQPGQVTLSNLLWNLHKYYSQFSDCIQNKIGQLRQPIEKELKDFVKISKWNDVSFWSIKQSVEKTHRTLFKFVKKFEEILNGPCLTVLVEQKNIVSLDNTELHSDETPIQRIRQALKQALPGKNTDHQEQDRGVKLESLQGRLPVLVRKMKKICVQYVKKHPAMELTEDLDFFTGEVLRNLNDLQSLTIDMSVEKDKRTAQVKHILQQKQRALSGLFQILREIGLSYRKGLIWSRTADQEETLCIQPLDMSTAFATVMNHDSTETRLLSELIIAGDGCQRYFYRSWARINALKTALHLGSGTVSQHQNSLLFSCFFVRRLTSTIQDIKDTLQSQGEDADGTLLPQAPLYDWVNKGHALAAQCSILLQQLSWLVQCCPEPPQLQEEENSKSWLYSLRCTSPMAAQHQPPVCHMRKGDATWSQLDQRVAAMLKQMLSLKTELHRITQQSSERVLLTWRHFVTCCSAFDQLATVASQLFDIEQLFMPATSLSNRNLMPAIIQSLQFVRKEAMTNVTEFTSWKNQHLSDVHPTSGEYDQSAFCLEFSTELDANINGLLCAVQTLVKRRENIEKSAQKVDKTELVEDLLKPRHFTHHLEEELAADVESMCVGDVNARLERLLSCLKMHTNSLKACRMLVRVEPLLGIYSDLVRYFLSVSVGVHRCTGKLLSVLANIFTELAQKGFCLPQELTTGEGEGATEFHDYEGGGIGQGEGTKDVSDTIENEDQVEDACAKGQEKEHQDDKKIKAEDNAIEMSEDFDGQTHDGDEHDADTDQEEELDKKMGELGDGQTDTLDERMWGGDEEDDDDDEEGGSDNEEESGQGMDQGESALAAKDDHLDAAEPDKNKQDSDDKMDAEEKDKINEQGDEREFDENEVDPYHGQQDKNPEPEAIDLPEDLNLDQDDEMEDNGQDEGDGESCTLMKNTSAHPSIHYLNHFILFEAIVEGDEEGPKEGDEEEGDEQMEEDNSNQKEKDNREPESQSETEKSEADPKTEDSESQKDENLSEEADGMDDAEDPLESAERKEHTTDGQTGEQNFQSDTAVELAGEASERDQAKEEHGTGAADASVSEGHQSKLTARMPSYTQKHNSTQSFKRKPGQADNERSTGDSNELVNKRLRTLESSHEQTQESRQGETQQESDLYEHIKEGDMAYDRQTYAGIESAEMHLQRQENEGKEWERGRHSRDPEEAEKNSESTFHTLTEMLVDTMQESAAAYMWRQYKTMTYLLSQQLSEQLRLILEPTQAAKLRGDYRTGKRLNMRKVIPYIASQFRKDKIWLRRTKPSKRDYQICLAVDDSSSMVDNHSKQLAFESLSVIVNALTLLEVGQVSVYSFGEQVQLLHPFQQQFNDDSGARILRLCTFQQKKTRIAQVGIMLVLSTAQLLIIVSDGRGLFLEGNQRVMAAVQAARSANVFLIFVVLDNPNSRDSILDIKVPLFKGPGELPEIRSYMEEFPFPFYVILRDVNALPETLSDALRQWFELVTTADQ
uniref:Midasin AAA ATPase 1 n=1 Tax=Hippocampus comes TaxID=109280 RepID=A0A3Q2XAQ5_HIPCM